VELAKLSLWLTTMSKGRPFGFLDHNLRSGDSLLGIHNLDQLIKLDTDPKGRAQLRLFGRTIRLAVDKALKLRARLREIPVRDIHDVEAMAALDARSREELALPTHIADAFVGIVLAEERAGERSARIETLAAFADAAASGITSAKDRLLQDASSDLAKDAPDDIARHAFHWPLEFPEVFHRENGGFDGIVGNPPFLGGQRITGILGTAYRDWLVSAIAEGRRGSADLVAYFFLRAHSLLCNGGGFGLLAVNTIAEGDTRQVGLDAMLRADAVIHAAYPNEPWPGAAAVVTSRVHVRKGAWKGPRSLLGRPAPYISAFLSDREEWSPKQLKANTGIAFQGSIVLGMGFVLTHEEAQRMLDADPRNAEVIFPYLNGEDVNSNPSQTPSRWVINFWDWPEERAKEYSLPYMRVAELVQPERQKNKRELYRRKWWQYAEKRPALYHAIGQGHNFIDHPKGWCGGNIEERHVMVCSEVTKYLSFAIIPNTYVMSANLDVFTKTDEFFWVGQSAIHDAWARQYSSRLETRLKYSPGNAFETFAAPDYDSSGSCRELGRCLNGHRHELMEDRQVGITKLYNLFHRRGEHDRDIQRLRELHCQIDTAVAQAYGWTDLDLRHDFHEVPYLPENDRVRFTISEAARVEILHRLSELNRQRYQEEVEQGLHGGRSGSGNRRDRLSRAFSGAEPALELDDALPMNREGVD
jgi:hypothetical protein